MSFDLWGFTGSPFISVPTGAWGIGLVAAYTLVLLGALFASRQSWRSLNFWQWLGVLVLSVAGLALAQLFIVHFPADIISPPNLPVQPQRPGLPLLALLPAFLAAGWLGGGPALVVGFVTGLGRAAWESNSIFTPFEFAFVAGVFAWCVRQDYRGWIARALRSPFVAAVLAGGSLWALLYISFAASAESAGLAAVDYVLSIVAAAAPVFFGQAVIAGFAAEFIRAALPTWWIQRRGATPPPWLYSLNQKLLYALIPLFLVGLLFLFIANINIVMGVSTNLALRQMERAAQSASRDIPFFIQTGDSLMLEIANSQNWFQLDRLARTAGLLQSMRALPFFKQLALLDKDLIPVATAGLTLDTDDLPPLPPEQAQLAELALQRIPQNTTAFSTEPGSSAPPTVDVIFFYPVVDPATREPLGVLVGWADLASNPLMYSTFNNLKNIGIEDGSGFIVDEAHRIIYHPDPINLQQTFVPDASAARLETQLPDAEAYRGLGPNATQQLTMYYPLPGHPWAVVVTVPNRTVLGLSAQIATPIIVFLLITGTLGLLFVSVVARRLARPAKELALAAQRISEDEKQLDQPVQVDSEDEIGRAGAAFERMRQKLRARLSELNLLLNVSKGVSSSLNLESAMPSILQGALTATSASGARIVLLPSEPGLPDDAASPYQTFADGPAAEVMAPLDRGVLELTRVEGRAVIDNLARAKAVLDVAPTAGKLAALVALPLRQENMFYGALWLAYDKPHLFSDSELNFLTLLAGQAAVAIANMRLFESAEQGRGLLASILASVPDAVIVTDRSNRVLLFNPAAEAAFELTNQPVVGRLATEALPHRDLVTFILEGRPTGATAEFEVANGRTMYASVTTITAQDGATLGRVCVLRDVTHFKEVDMMKSEFVATVSHDLRAPLTFMRGYATMMPMVGTLNDKQREFADKIVAGIEQMTKLIDDLLDLGRIEAGVGLAKEPCRLDDIVHGVVDALNPVASNKGLQLNVEIPRNLPLVSGDPTLLRQAVANLVDNAIKYTPAGGQVRVSVSTENGKFCVAVTDTGVGIAPADQAHLFEKFFRVKQRGSTQVKGSGLGLAIVKSIVERHGGRVWMESRLGRGSTFFIEVPRDGGATRPLASSQTPS